MVDTMFPYPLKKFLHAVGAGKDEPAPVPITQLGGVKIRGAGLHPALHDPMDGGTLLFQ